MGGSWSIAIRAKDWESLILATPLTQCFCGSEPSRPGFAFFLILDVAHKSQAMAPGTPESIAVPAISRLRLYSVYSGAPLPNERAVHEVQNPCLSYWRMAVSSGAVGSGVSTKFSLTRTFHPVDASTSSSGTPGWYE